MSSYQLDTPQRGFSYHEDAPLDMRMDRTQGETAAQWLTAPPADGAAHVLAAAAQTATFAAFADDALPPPPPPAEGLLLVRGGRHYAVLAPDRVGEAAAYRVMERK